MWDWSRAERGPDGRHMPNRERVGGKNRRIRKTETRARDRKGASRRARWEQERKEKRGQESADITENREGGVDAEEKSSERWGGLGGWSEE